MLVDPNATSMNDMRWIAQRIRRPLKDVKADERYNYAARQKAISDKKRLELAISTLVSSMFQIKK